MKKPIRLVDEVKQRYLVPSLPERKMLSLNLTKQNIQWR